jgi:hypothetical protein
MIAAMGGFLLFYDFFVVILTTTLETLMWYYCFDLFSCMLMEENRKWHVRFGFHLFCRNERHTTISLYYKCSIHDWCLTALIYAGDAFVNLLNHYKNKFVLSSIDLYLIACNKNITYIHIYNMTRIKLIIWLPHTCMYCYSECTIENWLSFNTYVLNVMLR